MLDGLILHFYPRERILVNCRSKEKALEAHATIGKEAESIDNRLITHFFTKPIIKIIFIGGTEIWFRYPELPPLCGFSPDREIDYE